MDIWTVGNIELSSRLLLGTARYPSPEVLSNCIEQSQTQIITISLRREAAHESATNGFWQQLYQRQHLHILPNTAGCHSVKEAVLTAHLARELFKTHWIKLEVIGNTDTLQPDPFGTVEAARILCEEGFEVFPYTTDDLVVAEKLCAAGCKILMPWGSPIGTGRGLQNPVALQTLRARLPEATLIVDAGIGRPSDACQAMELGYDAVLLNTAVALAAEPEQMAAGFAAAVQAGRQGFIAGAMTPQEHAQASTPTIGQPFWHSEGYHA